MVQKLWQGRIDGLEQEHFRWHQIIKDANLVENYSNHFVIVGFESDEGVKRNKGRVGAAEAPNVLRSVMSNLPAHELSVIYDLGNISYENEALENAQSNLTEALNLIYQKDGKSLVLGGGHEVTFPHFDALRKTYAKSRIGIINFDAHFDNRILNDSVGPTSGTGFYQIAEKEQSIHSLHIGIQKNSNSQALFNYAHQNGMKYILADDFYNHFEKSKVTTQQFIEEVDILYLTICMDVFSSAFAPGVSATAYNGMIPDANWRSFFSEIIKSPKLKAFDIAEVNPPLDMDNRTSKLASSFIFELLQIH